MGIDCCSSGKLVARIAEDEEYRTEEDRLEQEQHTSAAEVHIEADRQQDNEADYRQDIEADHRQGNLDTAVVHKDCSRTRPLLQNEFKRVLSKKKGFKKREGTCIKL